MNSLKEKLSSIGNSPVQNLVDKATSEYLLGSDQALNEEIFNTINAGDGGVAKDAVKTTRKKLKSKNPKVVLLALALAEGLVRHCNTATHLQIGGKDFMEQMVKLADRAGGERDVHVYDKVLELVQLWGEVFRTRRQTFPLFVETLESLKAAGHRFPPISEDTVAAYRNDMNNVAMEYRRQLAASSGSAVARSAVPGQRQAAPQQQMMQLGQGSARGSPAHQQTQQHAQQQPHSSRRPASAAQHQQQPQQPPLSAEEAAAKLKRELDVVRQTTELLSQMIAAHAPGEDPDTNDIMTELVGTCRDYAPKLVSLITESGDRLGPELMSTLLELNDDVQRCLDNFARLRRGEIVDADTLARQIAAEGLSERERLETAAAITASQLEHQQHMQQLQQQQQHGGGVHTADLLDLSAPAAPPSVLPAHMLSPAPANASAAADLEDEFAALSLERAHKAHAAASVSPQSAGSAPQQQQHQLQQQQHHSPVHQQQQQQPAKQSLADDDFDLLIRRPSSHSTGLPPVVGVPAAAATSTAAPVVASNPFAVQPAPAFAPVPQPQVASNPFLSFGQPAEPAVQKLPLPVLSHPVASPAPAVADDDPFAALAVSRSSTAAAASPAAASAPASSAASALDDFDQFLAKH